MTTLMITSLKEGYIPAEVSQNSLFDVYFGGAGLAFRCLLGGAELPFSHLLESALSLLCLLVVASPYPGPSHSTHCDLCQWSC